MNCSGLQGAFKVSISDEKGGLSELCRALCRSTPDVTALRTLKVYVWVAKLLLLFLGIFTTSITVANEVLSVCGKSVTDHAQF